MANNRERDDNTINDPVYGRVRVPHPTDTTKSDVQTDKPESQAIVPTFPELLQMSNQIEEREFEYKGKIYKIKIRALSYGVLQDIGQSGKDKIETYRCLLVWKGMVDPPATSFEAVLGMPYGLVASVGKAIEELSKSTRLFKKKS
jgi:hypothetical protein